jgi:hypothetical protein
VEWLLYTTEPIATVAQVLRIVDVYRARWRIEELFKALKTGCTYEDCQAESRDALEKVLWLYLPIAACLLALRDYAARTPEADATPEGSATRRSSRLAALAAPSHPALSCDSRH